MVKICERCTNHSGDRPLCGTCQNQKDHEGTCDDYIKSISAYGDTLVVHELRKAIIFLLEREKIRGS